MNKKFVEINGENIAYYDLGNSQGQTIVFVHGNSHSSESFQPQLESSLAEKFRLIALDLPGHGDSSWPTNESYSLTYFANTLKNFTQKLNIENALFVGHSLGGHIVLQAAPLLNKPQGIMIFGTPPLRPTLESMQSAFKPNPAFAGFLKADLSNEEVVGMAESCYAHDEVTNWRNSIDQILKTDPMVRENLATAIGNCMLEDEINILEKLTCPFAIAIGEGDKIVSQDYILNLKLSNIWGLTPLVLSEAGHSLQMEAPQEINTLIEYMLGLTTKPEELTQETLQEELSL